MSTPAGAVDGPTPTYAAPAALRLVVADDQTVIREALATMLDLMPDLEVVATAADGAAAVAAVEAHVPDVVLMDLRMPGMGGVEATRAVTAAHPGVAVVILTTFADDDSILAALGAGARGYLTKDAGREDIARAVHAAAAGQAVLDPGVQARLIAAAVLDRGRPSGATTGLESSPSSTGSPPGPARPAGVELTAREREVLAAIAAGLTNREIAASLFVSEATVKTHINNLFAKAGLRDRAHAVHYAFTHDLTGPR